MIEYPTDYYPNDVAFDINATDGSNAISFIFNGDAMSGAYFRGYDYTTGEILSTGIVASESGKPFRFNGDKIQLTPMTGLINGHDYTAQVLITQRNMSGTENIYDIAVLSGELQRECHVGDTSIYIEDRITNIYEWGDNGLICTPDYQYGYYVIGMIVKINNQSYFILSYNKSTGEIVLDTPMVDALPAGTRYQIYSNYKISPQYFYKCRTTPEVSVELQANSFGIKCVGNYYQAENSLIKHYRFVLYKINSARQAIQVGDSGKIFSQNIEYTFPEHYRLNGDTSPYKVELEIVTQDNVSITVEQQREFTPAIQEDVWSTSNPHRADFAGNTLRYVNIYYQLKSSVNNGHCRIYRENVDTGELVFIGTDRTNDYTISSHGRYRYIFVPYSANNLTQDEGLVYESWTSDIIETDFVGYTITALYDSGKDSCNRPFYFYGDTWYFEAEIEDTTITQNINSVLHYGYGQYSSISNADTNYLSGSVSGMLGHLNCTTKEYIDDIQTVIEWRKFISQKCLYILRSQKGDVWLVNIVDNPTTEYQENYNKFPTRFNFSWAECGNINDILIGRTLPFDAKDRR